MTDFLLELRSEEIPARMQDRAREDLARLFAAELAKAGLSAAALVTFATPRRLALIARGLPDATEAVSEEVKGPRASAPPQALDGFLRKMGLSREQLVERDGVLFALTEKPGRSTAEVLADAIAAIVRAFPWPKSMRWGAASQTTESLRWVRPLHGIVALFGDEIVPVEIAGITSGAATLGHRFHHTGPITIGSAADYEEKLRACHVIVDQDQRRAIIRDRAAALATEAGLVLVEDEGLVAENAGLTEWPVPLLGRFDEAFLAVPPEVIQLTARVNQKYFVCRDEAGKLANAFVCTANIEATDGGAKIVEGNRKVLAARLSDARFFYDTDLKVPLAEQAKKLDRIVFHEKLGTVADKVERVAKLARWLVEEGIVRPAPLPSREGLGVGGGAHDASSKVQPTPDPSLSRRGELADLAERAARLAKADLVTGMVGEFPEMQGLMGGYYAAAQGEDPAIADAIRNHYKPVGHGDDVPTAPVTVAVSLADKFDSISVFFSADERPTGSKDPFALRRAALGIIDTILTMGLRVNVNEIVGRAYDVFRQQCDNQLSVLSASMQHQHREMSPREQFNQDMMLLKKREVWSRNAAVTPFLLDRLKVQQREAGIRHDLIDAVFALGGKIDLILLLARVRTLQAFVGTDEGANLLAGYKRAANILKKEGYGYDDAGDGTSEAALRALITLSSARERPRDWLPDEAALQAALDAAEPAAAAAVMREDFEAAMAALASLRAPIDAFFDSVTVNDSDPVKRESRLALLARVRAAVHQVADFSRIEG